MTSCLFGGRTISRRRGNPCRRRQARRQRGEPSAWSILKLCECDAWQKFQQMAKCHSPGLTTSVEINWRVQTYSNKRRIDNWKSLPEEGGARCKDSLHTRFICLSS